MNKEQAARFSGYIRRMTHCGRRVVCNHLKLMTEQAPRLGSGIGGLTGDPHRWGRFVGGIGLEGHEQPFIDMGDETELRPGMVLSVEPGLYVPGFAGFRHSDTVVITETGCDSLTFYPRDLDSLIVPG